MEAAVIDSRNDYEDDPSGKYKYWCDELKGAQKRLEKWHKQGNRIVKRYLDERRDDGDIASAAGLIPFRLNLFHSNITSLTSMLYGNLPKVDVSRRYQDSSDDVSRVAAEIMERLLNNDIADNGEEVNAVLRSTLQDRLLPGLGCARVRYEFESQIEEIEIIEAINGAPVTSIQENEVLLWEDAPVDYFYWGDVLWSWGRNWSELTWIAYRVFLTKDEATERFGEKKAKNLQYQKQRKTDENDALQDSAGDIWNKAEIWEIWDKRQRTVCFLSKGYDKLLDEKEDPLGLSGFFPSPPFFLANQTTMAFTPTPDFHLAQDLYNEVDRLQTRIAVITEAVKVVGVYDAANSEIERMFQEGCDNDLIPVKNYALFGEKGGLQGQVDWLPLGDIVNALDKLVQQRDQTIDLLRQVTGMNEIMRGGSQGQYEGVGQAQLQAKFGSIRIQALQEEFSIFCSNLMQLKAEVVARHFSPETIAARSNIARSFDGDIAPQAIELIKRPEEAKLRIKIRPESVAMVDYAQLKAERTEYINALAIFMQSASPLIEQQPQSTPFLLELLRWGLSGFKGSQEIEGVIDKAIDQAVKAQQQPQQDPAAAAQQAQMQMQMQIEQLKQQGELSKIQAKAEADIRLREADKVADIETTMAAHNAKMEEIGADLQSKIAQTQAKMEADIAIERAQAESNITQTMASAQAEIDKDSVNTELEVGKESVKSELKINEIAAAAAGKISEQRESKKEMDDNDDDD